VKGKNYEAPYYVILSSLVAFRLKYSSGFPHLNTISADQNIIWYSELLFL